MTPDMSKVGKANAPNRDCAIVWMHIGDLHLTVPDVPNHLTLREIIAQANEHLASAINFVVLVGDNADESTRRQYRLLRSEHYCSGIGFWWLTWAIPTTTNLGTTAKQFMQQSAPPAKLKKGRSAFQSLRLITASRAGASRPWHIRGLS